MGTSQQCVTYEDALQILSLKSQGFYRCEIAAAFGIGQGVVNDVLEGRLYPGARLAARSII